jgi:predicted PurR-regulated permease PerM
MLKKLANRMSVKMNVSNRTVVRILLLVLAFSLGLQLAYAARSAIALLVVACFIAIALNPPVSYLTRRLPGNSRGLATAIAYTTVLLSLALIISASIPPLVSETKQFIADLPRFAEELKSGHSLPARVVDSLQLEDELGNLQTQLTSRIGNAGGPVLSLLQRISANLLAVVTVLVLAFFMLVEGPQWVNRLLALQPKARRERTRSLALKMYRVVTGYVNGQILISFIGAISALTVMTALKFFAINVPFIIPLAAIIFMTGLIPLFGNTIGAVFVVGIALFESLPAALIMAVFFLVYQQVENNAIQPIIQARSVEMTPLMVLVAAIFGVTLAGILGALIAIPLAGCLRILLNDYIHRHRARYALSESDD